MISNLEQNTVTHHIDLQALAGLQQLNDAAMSGMDLQSLSDAELMQLS